MKSRCGFVTNSSSSSFIIRNTSDKEMTPKEIAMSLFERIIEDADNAIPYPLSPGQEIEIECEDHYENYFETFIHNECGGIFSDWNYNVLGDIEIEFVESHH